MAFPASWQGQHDTLTVQNGVLRVHPPFVCAAEGHPCAIHAPSRHTMDDGELVWDPDTQSLGRLCQHGCIHPDPDDIAFIRANRGEPMAEWILEMHVCCEAECCRVGSGVCVM